MNRFVDVGLSMDIDVGTYPKKLNVVNLFSHESLFVKLMNHVNNIIMIIVMLLLMCWTTYKKFTKCVLVSL